MLPNAKAAGESKLEGIQKEAYGVTNTLIEPVIEQEDKPINLLNGGLVRFNTYLENEYRVF